jgi:hypothetical protein
VFQKKTSDMCYTIIHKQWTHTGNALHEFLKKKDHPYFRKSYLQISELVKKYLEHTSTRKESLNFLQLPTRKPHAKLKSPSNHTHLRFRPKAKPPKDGLLGIATRASAALTNLMAANALKAVDTSRHMMDGSTKLQDKSRGFQKI